MTYPPPPGGPPPAGPPPPPHGNPYPPQGYPDPQQPWPPQQHWPAGPPPKKRGTGWKWGLGIVAVLAVIAVTAAVTISVTKDSGEGATSPSGETFGLASADDTGPANIITEDPTCAAWRPIVDSLVAVEQQEGWDARDPGIPAEDWTPDQQQSYDAVGEAMRKAADQAVSLAKATPHRVMRQLYEQFIAYARAYSDSIADYVPEDNHLAGATNASSGAVTFACSAIEWGSAAARAPLIANPEPPSEVSSLTSPERPEPFLSSPDPTCPEWYRLLSEFNDDTQAWQALDANIPASNWSPQQRRIVDEVIPIMSQFADDVETLGRTSTNATLQDFAIFSAQYRRAYADALPTYNPGDSLLARTANRSTSTIFEACRAAGG